jgi:GalNAc-alpha-(1->4)-GalNAc-alpha-(1->3)-diNAcBac-PP-undecaprenol alpha-1,4-N-acetyl-D-galactosaminyltransferase
VKVAFVISTLEVGGAERVLALMANHWAGKGHDVSVLTFDDGRCEPFYTLDSGVRHVPLAVAGESGGLAQAIVRNAAAVRGIRRALRTLAPDVVVSFMDKTNVTTLIAAIGSGLPVIVAEHTDPWSYDIGSLWKALRRLSYPWARRIVVLNEHARQYFPPAYRERVLVMPNPIVVAPQDTPSPRPAGRRVVASMGRFTREKGFDLLLRAFAGIADAHPAWDLLVLGDGPLRPELESLRDSLGLRERIFMPGVSKNPHGVLRHADLYVAPSRIEGFPCALGEAMALGLAVIATEYHPGVRDLIRTPADGVLVPSDDADALAAAMADLMDDPQRRAGMGESAVAAIGRFGVDAIMTRWERLVLQAIGQTGPGQDAENAAARR